MARDHFVRHNHHEGVIDWNFNVVLGQEPSVAAMAETYRPILQKPWFYDPIPNEWLHTTILRIGTVADYTEEEMLAVADKVQVRVNELQLPEFHFGPHIIIHGNVCLKIEPESELEKLYAAVTESLEEVVGAERATKSPYGHFIAHTSLVYSKERENEAETEVELNAAEIEPASFRIHHMPLIRQRPTNGHYEWKIVKNIEIPGPSRGLSTD
ncbi:MAG TPA: 2'-5' RNA ligase family protein [Candidatus Saccharimonadales bacterium]|nr:2'-5' RNA ligase family protein [Candidatus Saccharimonadales bacterium]